MVERKRRKKNKVRGERTHGQGDTKNNRGGGSRGGRGRAGSNKHNLFSIGQKDPRKYRLKSNKKGKSISVGNLDSQIETLLKKGKITKEKEFYVIDEESGYKKILSQGTIKNKIFLKISATKPAIKKIKDAGGKVEQENLLDEDFEENSSK